MSNAHTFTSVDFDPFGGKEIEKITTTTEPQRELWLSCVLGGEDANRAYNESVSLEFDGTFDISSFKKAIHDLILRHEALRSTLSSNGENLVIYKNLPVEINVQDISAKTDEDQKSILNKFLHDELNIAFDLHEGPLFRVFIHKLNETRHYFTLIIHHIIGDGWSIGIILQDLSKLYNLNLLGESINLPKAPQISEYAAEQLNYNKSEEYKATENFWFNQFRNDVPVLDMPLDFSRPPVRTYKGGRNNYLIQKDLFDKIKGLAARSGCSLVTTLLGAFELFIYRETGQQEIVIGLPAAGQSATGNYGLVGHCVNLLPLKSSINPENTFPEYLKKRKGELYDAYDNQRFTFSELLKKINIRRDRSRIPLVPVVFNVDMELDAGVSFKGLTYKLSYNAREFQTFEISLNIAGSKGSLELQWSYNTQLFKSVTITKMIDEFIGILARITENPGLRIDDIVAGATPFRKLSILSVPYPKDKTIIDLFFEQVRVHPDNTAVVFENKKITYQELDTKANQLAIILGPGE
ncbi:MAG: condensation domain-containing protein [Bacteroidota bacterium]